MRVLIALISVLLLIVPSLLAADTLPRELSDEAFWRLISDFSEQGGAFRFEYMSNEHQFQYVIPRLRENGRPGGVYIGVGPEQNFTYIAALQPRMAFIIDIRRQNMLEHLFYKALMETSADRPEFLSRLFSRRGVESTGNSEFFETNTRRVVEYLENAKGFRLSPEDEAGIRKVAEAFFKAGPEL